MRTSTRVGGYVLGLAAVFAAALGAGHGIGPVGAQGVNRTDVVGQHGQHGEQGRSSGTVKPAAGLQVAQDGYRLEPLTPSIAPGVSAEFAFRLIGPGGTPVTRYIPTHERDLHLIVVRRDLSGFQHLHPTLDPDGTWRTPVTVPAAGQYRFFADFRPAERAEPLTLGVDIPASGDYQPASVMSADGAATVDGYTVELAGTLVPGTSSKVTARVSRNGSPVTDLQPYLGAYGHLVTLRAGDLAYLHTHPEGTPSDGRTPAGPEVTFYVEVPSGGTYRLYLDFQHGGVVTTATFAAAATDGPASGPSTPERGAHN